MASHSPHRHLSSGEGFNVSHDHPAKAGGGCKDAGQLNASTFESFKWLGFFYVFQEPKKNVFSTKHKCKPWMFDRKLTNINMY